MQDRSDMPPDARAAKPRERRPPPLDEWLSRLDELSRGDDERAFFHTLLTGLVRDYLHAAVAVQLLEANVVHLIARAPEPFPGPMLNHASLRGVLEAGSFRSLAPVDASAALAGAPVATADAGRAPSTVAEAASGSPGPLAARYPFTEQSGLVIEARFDGRREAPNTLEAQRLLEASAELAGQCVLRRRYRQLEREAASSQGFDSLVRSWHAAGSLPEAAALLSETLPGRLGYDRAWVCQVRGSRCRVLAAAGGTSAPRRRTLTRLVEAVAATAAGNVAPSGWTFGPDSALPTPLMSQFIEESAARRVLLLPLRGASPPNDPVAVVVLEGFSGEALADESARLERLTPHAALCLEQAQRRRGWWGRAEALANGRPGLRVIIGLATAAAAAVGLALPTDFEVDVDGRLQPVLRRSMFAPGDGVVSALEVRHDELVEPGRKLLSLRDPKLDAEEQRLAGEQAELLAQQRSVETLRVQGSRAGGRPAAELSAQESEIRQALEGVQRQLEILRLEQQQLVVHSPIRGVVDRWDLEPALALRPVIRGQHLLDIVDLEGRWRLELELPDRRAAPVYAALQQGGRLEVRYRFRTDPVHEHRTTLSEVAERVELNDRGDPIIRCFAELSPEAEAPRRAGAAVVARIPCGRRARAYVWFHELWDYAYRKWLL